MVGACDRLDRGGRGLRGPGHAGGAAAPAFGWQRGPAVAFRGPVLAGTRRLDGGLSTGRLVGRGGRVRNGIDRALRIGGARARGGLARVARRGTHDPGASPCSSARTAPPFAGTSRTCRSAPNSPTTNKEERP